MATRELMQVRAAASVLGVHENTLRRWEEAGLIDAVRLPSGVRRFRVEDINDLREQMYRRSRPNPVVEQISQEELTRAKQSSATVA